MKKFLTIGVLGVVGFVAISALSIFIWAIGVSNQEISLRTDFNAQVQANQTDFDNMWKTIQQKYQIKGDFEKTFKDIFAEVAQGRQGGTLFKSVQESVPGLDTGIYKELMATIEGKRDQFESHQKKAIDIQKEHQKLVAQFPSSLIVGSRPALVLTLVISTKTTQAFTTGKDDDVILGK